MCTKFTRILHIYQQVERAIFHDPSFARNAHELWAPVSSSPQVRFRSSDSQATTSREEKRTITYSHDGSVGRTGKEQSTDSLACLFAQSNTVQRGFAALHPGIECLDPARVPPEYESPGPVGYHQDPRAPAHLFACVYGVPEPLGAVAHGDPVARELGRGLLPAQGRELPEMLVPEWVEIVMPFP